MPYAVKEIYYTLQGEGVHTGRPAVFLRFSGCNLWSGREEDREHATCQFCDTDFFGTDGPGGGRYETASSLADAVSAIWDRRDAPEMIPVAAPAARDLPWPARPFVVCTGGEPLLQLDADLLGAFRARGFHVAVETNGTLPVPSGIDWLCVSPKAGAPLMVRRGNELKLVFPQEGLSPDQFADLSFDHFSLQPMDGPEREANTLAAVAYCLAHPHWRLSLQTHKLIGLP
ncbi:MAG: 7-carboxy-7-deazaguanine synthase [Rhodothermales bacterium]|nr:7-carboxy-7-deazaguanine synthase [Rhodothermales bacterium]MBO6780957.1 7-carboxy-7-deazaguanine synthase [Rhodothermales bacterium]